MEEPPKTRLKGFRNSFFHFRSRPVPTSSSAQSTEPRTNSNPGSTTSAPDTIDGSTEDSSLPIESATPNPHATASPDPDLLPSGSEPLSTWDHSAKIDNLTREDSLGIEVLHDPGGTVVDIVFIHGLTGNAYTTWLDKATGVHWPRDLLPKDVPYTRIMTFEYDADVVNLRTSAAIDTVAGYANDLLGCLDGCREGFYVRR